MSATGHEAEPEKRELTDAEKREKEIKRLKAILAKNPNCVWAKNELKYIDVRNLSGAAVVISGGAYSCDSMYHGGYTE